MYEPEEMEDPCPRGWEPKKLMPDQRDATPRPPAYIQPLAVLISSRAVTVAKDWTGKK